MHEPSTNLAGPLASLARVLDFRRRLRAAGSTLSANPHTSCALSARLRLASVALSLSLAGAAGCADGATEAAPVQRAPDTPAVREAAAKQVQALVDLIEPIDPSWTSDRQTRTRFEQRAAIEELKAGTWIAGSTALEVFESLPETAIETRKALIEIAAHTDPEGSCERLVSLVRTYVPGQDPVRVEAARLLSETSPSTAVELFGELLGSPQNVTLPPAELLLRYWIAASRTLAEAPQGAVPFNVTFLADIATDLMSPAELRYVAVEALGGTPGNLSKSALRTLLVESGPDGLLRRKAAQALAELLPSDEACAIFREVADKETEGGFLPFLLDMLNTNCL